MVFQKPTSFWNFLKFFIHNLDALTKLHKLEQPELCKILLIGHTDYREGEEMESCCILSKHHYDNSENDEVSEGIPSLGQLTWFRGGWNYILRQTLYKTKSQKHAIFSFKKTLKVSQ